MIALMTAIESAFTANGTLTAAWTGGLSASRAPEGTEFPYLVYFIPPAMTTTTYGQHMLDDVVVRFVGRATGCLATGTKMELLDTAFANTVLTLSSGKCVNCYTANPPAPLMADGVDKNGDEVWAWTATYVYTVSR